MTKPLQYSRFYFLNDVFGAIKFVINTSPIQSSLLICAILVSGFVPALSIKLTSIIIDKVASVDAHLISYQIFFYVVYGQAFYF